MFQHKDMATANNEACFECKVVFFLLFSSHRQFEMHLNQETLIIFIALYENMSMIFYAIYLKVITLKVFLLFLYTSAFSYYHDCVNGF